MLLILAALAQIAAALAALDLRWMVPLGTAPAAASGFDAATTYVPLRAGGLVAVDLERGTVRWRRDELQTAIAPGVGESMVFVADEQGLVQALAAGTGQTRWRTPLPGPLASITWDNGWLLCSSQAGDLAALRAADGELVWRVVLGAPLVLPPAAGLDRVYVALEGGRVMSLDLATGQRGWEQAVDGRLTLLRVVEGQLLAGGTGKAVFSFDLATGRQRWRWRVGGDVSGAAASYDRLLFFSARDNIVRAVDSGSGNLRWTAELPSRPLSGPQIAADAVLVPMSAGVAVYDAATGKSLGVIAASGELSAAPHVREGRPTGARLVALSRDGRLQGFGLRVEEAPAPLTVLPGQAVVP